MVEAQGAQVLADEEQIADVMEALAEPQFRDIPVLDAPAATRRGLTRTAAGSVMVSTRSLPASTLWWMPLGQSTVTRPPPARRLSRTTPPA